MDKPKFPNVKVKLTGENGNAFFIIGKCLREAKKQKVPLVDIDKFQREAASGDYDNLLCVAMKYFNIQ